MTTTDVATDLEQELLEARRRVRHLEQRLVEQRVETRSQQAILATVVDHAPVVLWAIDRQGILTLSEGRGLEGLGYRPGQIIGQSVFELHYDRPDILNQFRRALQGEVGKYLNEVQGRWFESWLAPTRDSTGAVTGVIGVATDVTERQRAQQAAQASAERFRRVFDASPVAVSLTELESGRFVDVNAAFCRLTGYQPEQLVGKTTAQMGFWPNAAARGAALSAVTEGTTLRRAEHRLRTAEGKLLVLRFAAKLITIDGKPCLMKTLHNATRLKRREAVLRRSREHYRQLSQFAPIGIFHATAEHGWTYANHRLGELWGANPTALRGWGWLEAVHPDERERVEAAYRKACVQTTPLAIEFRIRPAVDSTRWIILRLETQPEQAISLGTIADITQRIQTAQQLKHLNADLESRVADRTAMLVRANQMLQEQIFERRAAIEQLQESQERWRSLVENAPDIVMQLNRDRTIAFVNHTNARPSLTPEMIRGQSVLKFVDPAYVDVVRRDLDRVFDRGESVSHEVLAPGDDGGQIWFQSHISPIVHHGRVTGATVVARDVTQMKRAAEELKQTQDNLIHVARVTSAGEMAAGLAHELNQPLAAIANFVRGCMIRLQDGKPASPEVLETLQESVDEAHRASEVIRRLRQFLQRQEMHCEPALLNDVVNDALRLIEPAFRRHDTEPRVQFASELPPVVVDRVQFMQVVLNLLLNAAEAMADANSPTRRLTIETARAVNGDVELRISDDGPGLPAELGKDIFEPFVTTKAGGLGMGLSICRTIIEAHEGTLRGENLHAPRGARFVVTLPVNPRTAT